MIDKGILLFAHNNVINYTKLSIICAIFIKLNLDYNLPIVLVTDDISKSTVDDSLLKELFMDIIINNIDTYKNQKIYNNQHESITSEFKNTDRLLAYELSPFKETLLIDSDYMVLNNSLNKIWNNGSNICANTKLLDTNFMDRNLKVYERYLSDKTIPTTWATVLYFDRSNVSKEFFILCDYVKTYYEYFSELFMFSTKPSFRNDFVISVARHILSGGIHTNIIVNELPENYLIFSWDLLDRVLSIRDKNSILLETKKKHFDKKSMQTSIIPLLMKNNSFHCLNKLSLLNFYDDVVSMYYESIR